MTQVNEGQEMSEYRVTVGKKVQTLLITRMGNPIVILPDDGREVSIGWSGEKSHALDTRQLLDEYLRQEKTKE